MIPEIHIINDIIDQDSDTNKERRDSERHLSLKVSSLKKFFDKQGVVLTNTHDASVELARRILKNSNTANKKRSLENSREIVANINY